MSVLTLAVFPEFSTALGPWKALHEQLLMDPFPAADAMRSFIESDKPTSR